MLRGQLLLVVLLAEDFTAFPLFFVGAGLLWGCSTTASKAAPAPVCTPSCVDPQTCEPVCLGNGATTTQCVVAAAGGVYVGADGGPVYDVCLGF